MSKIEYIRRFASKGAEFYIVFNLCGTIKEYFKIVRKFRLKTMKYEDVILIWNSAARKWFNALDRYPNLTKDDLIKLWS